MVEKTAVTTGRVVVLSVERNSVRSSRVVIVVTLWDRGRVTHCNQVSAVVIREVWRSAIEL